MVDLAEIDDRIAKCNKILEENPNSQIFAALAEAFRKKGQIDQAFRVCQNGLRIHPKYASAHMVMARINLDKGMYDWAELEVKKAVELEGDSHTTDLLLSEIFINRGEFAKATKILNRLNKLDPGNSQVTKLLELTRRLPLEVAGQMHQAPPEPDSPPPVAAKEPAKRDEAAEPDDATPAPNPAPEGLTLTEGLDKLAEINGIEGVLLVNKEGLVAETRWIDEEDPELYGALARDIEKTIQSQLADSRFGDYENILIEADDMIVSIRPLSDSLLMIKANGQINLGTLRMKLGAVLTRLDELIRVG